MRRVVLGVLSAAILVMAITNLTGMRAMLASANDLSRVPLTLFAVLAAGKDPAMLQPGYRLPPSLVATRLTGSEDTIALRIPQSPHGMRGYVDRLEQTKGSPMAFAEGWAVTNDTKRKVAFIGAWRNGQPVAVTLPDRTRPDVDTVLGRRTGQPGFRIDFPAETDPCAVGIFAIDDLMQFGWVREPGKACPAK